MDPVIVIACRIDLWQLRSTRTISPGATVACQTILFDVDVPLVTKNKWSALKMRAALALLSASAPELEVDGEMHGDCALDEAARKAVLPDSMLKGSANLVVCPNLDSANIAYNLLKSAAGNNVAIGPILLGCAAPVHILTPAVTVRRIVNMTALCVVDANRAPAPAANFPPMRMPQ